MQTKSWKVALVFAGVFAAGVVAGGAWAWRFAPARHGDRPPGAGRMLKHMADELQLTEEQRAQVKPILARMSEEMEQLRRGQLQEFGKVMDRMHADIAAVLTPDQRVKLAGMRQRFRDRAERMRGEFRGENFKRHRDADGRPPRPDGGK